MSLLFQHKTKSAPHVENPYWMSFSDMINLRTFVVECTEFRRCVKGVKKR